MAAVKQEEGAASGRAKIMISGYESEMYNDYLQGWRKERFSSCAEGGRHRQEIVWMNYECYAQMTLADMEVGTWKDS